MDGPTVEKLFNRWPWKPLRNCPGRFVLSTTDRYLSVEGVLGQPRPPRIFHSPAAPDPVLVILLSDGGLISYARPDGTFVHTLNTPSGFSRKLQDLHISLDEKEGLPKGWSAVAE